MYKIPAKTLFLAKKIIFLPSCHSTNDEALHLVEKHSVIDGSVVITNQQTAGRGQRGNVWLSEPGMNLTFSLILKPGFVSIARQFDLNIAISLGILDFLKKYKSGFQVKWPNDIYYQENKICGILIQNVIKRNMIEQSVVGIGLNINQVDFHDNKPTSLATLTGCTHILDDVFSSLCEALEMRYLQLKRGEIDKMRIEYVSNLYQFGEDHLYRSKDVFQGRITGVTTHGLLEVESKRGLEQFNFKEIEFL